jgi:hypothetical protein
VHAGDKPALRGVAAFALRVIAWGLVCFPAWYFASSPLSKAVAAAASRMAESMGPVGTVHARIERRDAIFNVEPAPATVLVQRLPIGMSIEVPVNPLKHTFGIPFFLALLFASRPPGLAWKAPLGIVAIALLAALGMACDLLVQLRQAASPQGVLLFPFGAAAREAIAVGYQLGVLILPTVMPVVLWAAMHPSVTLPSLPRKSPPSPI